MEETETPDPLISENSKKSLPKSASQESTAIFAPISPPI